MHTKTAVAVAIFCSLLVTIGAVIGAISAVMVHKYALTRTESHRKQREENRKATEAIQSNMIHAYNMRNET